MDVNTSSDAVTAALPRNFLAASLLLLIGRRTAYGYSLRAQLVSMGWDRRDWSQLYRCLRTMERSGLVVSCWENSESGPARRTYHVTEKGAAQLHEWAEGIADAQSLVHAFLGRYSHAAQVGRAARPSA